MFWEKEGDIGLSIKRKTMSRKMSENWKSFIHFAGNNPLDTSDKFAKVRGMLDIMNKNLKQLGFFHTFYSIAEQMIPYSGQNSNKQRIWTQRIRFGYKNFILCSADGYPCFIDPYRGGKVSKNLSARSVFNCVAEVDN